MKKYFYSENGVQHGLFSIEEIKEKGISKETQIWHEGLDIWKPASLFPELISLLNVQPPPIINSQNKKIENTYLKNKFGIISNDRITFYNNLSWSNSGTKIEVKPQDISSAQLLTRRSILGIVVTLPIPIIFILYSVSCKIGLISCGYTEFYALFIISIPCSILSALWIFGYPQIEITVLGAYKNKMVGFPWDKKDSEDYIETLREKHNV